MTGTRDRFGEPLDAIEDDDPAPETTPRTPDKIRQHIAELRRILRESRERREAQA
jgi:hypothetical protein